MNQFNNEPPNYNQPNYNQPNNMGGMQQNLPNATIVLVLGILSIVLCFCYGILGIISGIIALIMAGKDKQLLDANPGAYTESSIKNLKAGRICAMIGTILSALYFLAVIALFIFYGAAIFSNPSIFMQP